MKSPGNWKIPDSSSVSIRSSVYYGLRLFLHRKRWLLRAAQGLRGCLILGPFRNLVICYYQAFGKNAPIRMIADDLFSFVNVQSAVDRIKRSGYTDLGLLSTHYVSRIEEYCEKTRRIRYWNPHKDCESVDRIARNAVLVEIARRYLDAEPILWLTQLIWSLPTSGNRAQLGPSMHDEPVQYDAHAFHYDAIDVRSLTLFVYLTDVNENSGAHVIIEGTHKSKTLKELLSVVLDDRVAQDRYGGQIKAIPGRKGTVFFEETSSFHKVSACKEPRLILSIDYAIGRKVPPERPTVEEHRGS